MPEATIERPVTASLANAQIQDYWNHRIHDLAIVKHPVGTPGFFDDLEEYRFEKLDYLPRVVDFNGYAGRTLLEIGCGAGIDLARFVKGGAIATGIDLSDRALDLARAHLEQQGLRADLRLMDGERMTFPDDSFDVVYAHGVLPYTGRAEQMMHEMYRVLKPGGTAIIMGYNRISWLNALSKVMKVRLEHEDAPVLRTFSISEIRSFLKPFKRHRITAERFPVKTRLHGGWKGILYNSFFVRAFNALPRAWVRPLGWHIMAFGEK